MEFTKTRYLVAVWGMLSGDPEEDTHLYVLEGVFVSTLSGCSTRRVRLQAGLSYFLISVPLGGLHSSLCHARGWTVQF